MLSLVWQPKVAGQRPTARRAQQLSLRYLGVRLTAPAASLQKGARRTPSWQATLGPREEAEVPGQLGVVGGEWPQETQERPRGEHATMRFTALEIRAKALSGEFQETKQATRSGSLTTVDQERNCPRSHLGWLVAKGFASSIPHSLLRPPW